MPNFFIRNEKISFFNYSIKANEINKKKYSSRSFQEPNFFMTIYDYYILKKKLFHVFDVFDDC
ncbi:hypothetical protein BpHYR1_004936 [Brachionus plicatilis]|uniref:Uncharacterized protein n=1 Tax=Brachionus plicatilis TaxID=10195 RepID=A0A3M7S1K3_BRAPC|nr:hypothetical protein BpHYR1_004936 [Brachionus plicatilis]